SVGVLCRMVAACASTRHVPLEIGTSTELDSVKLSHGIEIVGYQTRDNVYHSFHGLAQLRSRSWSFTAPVTWGQEEEPQANLPQEAVVRLDVDDGSYRNPIAVGAAIVLASAAVLGV